MRVYGEKNIAGRGKSECENLEARECLTCYRTAKQPVFLELRDIAVKMVSLESGPGGLVILSHEPEQGFRIVVVEAMEELNRRLTGLHLHHPGIFRMFLSLITIINLFYNVAQYKCVCIVCDCIRNRSIK